MQNHLVDTLGPEEMEELRYVAMSCMHWFIHHIDAWRRKFVGIEFAVVHAEPPGLFIIHKRERISPDEGVVVAGLPECHSQ